ncbi:MAG: energy transducer TonB [Alphaproteobacteria bacterium]|nr:MAG: energy transducer TonB [Alphaproteobacteria bacterium]
MSLLLAALLLAGGAPHGVMPGPKRPAAAAPADAAEDAPGMADMTPLFSNLDYPAKAIQAREQGVVTYRIIVSKEGGVRDCIVVESSGSELLDRTTCRIVRQRARFLPARDAQGNAIEDQFTSRTRWVLPD